mmetsp:Transcript_17768/g.35486  ORF Transcript_17768/g.35486 Transcript_17768/m.35486 type:complete len:269 (+) Transcript_17768:68-874(+)|eukprot:CAMPEP_0194339552 /NCGR_PEP_ID=MMETSP0171-20130528/83546_1 /TAXON_ID=218684 /ORGANISM="Corethron pennatum, Strain L29A3" /LENGTH=268 /DNA_ID=CAMNT_0039104153 /DNA_START=50 /DNA_END=856 /DNA_ORIENTATION=-
MGNSVSNTAKHAFRNAGKAIQAATVPQRVKAPSATQFPTNRGAPPPSFPTKKGSPTPGEMPEDLLAFLRGVGPAEVKIVEDLTSGRLMDAAGVREGETPAAEGRSGVRDDTHAIRSVEDTESSKRKRLRPLPNARPWMRRADPVVGEIGTKLSIAEEAFELEEVEMEEDKEDDGWKISEVQLLAFLEHTGGAKVERDKPSDEKPMDGTPISSFVLAGKQDYPDDVEIFQHIISKVAIPVVMEEKDGTKIGVLKGAVTDMKMLGMKEVY